VSDAAGSEAGSQESCELLRAAAPPAPSGGGAQAAGPPAHADRRRTSSPGGWWSPVAPLAKRIRRTASFGRLCGDVSADEEEDTR
jgi:hypothetical protein